MPSKLVFVYNSEKGFINGMMDTMHKWFSPSTYQCNLCAITHGGFGMHSEWKEFLDNLNMEIDYLGISDLKAQYGITAIELPAIFVSEADELSVLVSAEQINQAKTSEDLMATIASAVHHTS